MVCGFAGVAGELSEAVEGGGGEDDSVAGEEDEKNMLESRRSMLCFYLG
jgi:hypothetical protein